MHIEKRRILDYKDPMDHRLMMEYLNVFCERYPFIGVTSIGESIMGRNIPMVTIGEGKRSVLYVGAHHGMEWMTTALLLRYINEFCELYQARGRIYGYSLEYLFENRTICVVPMLNPDGVDYQINGVGRENPLYERILKMNCESEDFSSWQANARGVDLNHNYNAAFAEYKAVESSENISEGAPSKYSGNMPESEPEVASLCNYIRFNEEICGILTFHTQGEEIYFTSLGQSLPRAKDIAVKLSGMSGYQLSTPEGTAAYGGLTDWCISELKRLCFTVECGKGKNPLPIEENFKVYTSVREMLFCFPTLV